MNAMRPRKPGPRAVRRLDPEHLSTEEVIDLHERLCGPLDPVVRSRIIGRAYRRGWDRRWGMDGLAA
jgi:hypothetical protein